jgi:hypothetical protein
VKRRLLPSAILAIVIASAGTATPAAADDSFARAEALFESGSRAVNTGHFAEGCPLLEQARALVVGIGVTLYLGECYEQTGRLVDAWRQFRDAEQLATSHGDSRARIARQRSERLWPRLAKLVVLAPAGPDASHAQLEDNGAALGATELGNPRPVEPGAHRIQAIVNDRIIWGRSIDVAPGETAEVQVPSLDSLVDTSVDTTGPPPGSSPPPATSVPAAPMAPVRDTRDTPLGAQRIAGIGMVGLGVVGLVVGAAFGVEAQVKLNDSNSSGHCKPGDLCDASGLAERSDALTDASISTFAFLAGAASVAGGAVLYLLAPERTRVGFTLTPRTDGGAMAGVQGVF